MTDGDGAIQPAEAARSWRSRLIETALWVVAPLILIIAGWIVAALLGAPGPRVIVVASLVAIGLGGFHLLRPGGRLPVKRARAVGLLYAGIIAALAQIPSGPITTTDSDVPVEESDNTLTETAPQPAATEPTTTPSTQAAERGAVYPWPFSVQEATVACRNPSGRGTGMVTVTAPNGREYAVNGTARRSYPEVDAIWRADPDLPGARINIGPVIERGLALCLSAGRASPPLRIVPGVAPASVTPAPSTPAEPLPQIDESSLYLRLVNIQEVDGAVRGQVETNIALPVEIMVAVSLRGQRPDDTYIGNSVRVRLNANPQDFSVSTNVRGGLPRGEYDVEANFYPRWGANNGPPEARAIRRELQASQRISLRGNGGSARDTTAMNNARRWLMENTATGDRWNPSEFARRMGPSEQLRVTNRTEIIVAYYYPRADATVFVNTLNNELVVWRLGRTDTL